MVSCLMKYILEQNYRNITEEKCIKSGLQINSCCQEMQECSWVCNSPKSWTTVIYRLNITWGYDVGQVESTHMLITSTVWEVPPNLVELSEQCRCCKPAKLDLLGHVGLGLVFNQWGPLWNYEKSVSKPWSIYLSKVLVFILPSIKVVISRWMTRVICLLL